MLKRHGTKSILVTLATLLLLTAGVTQREALSHWLLRVTGELLEQRGIVIR